MPYGTFKPQKGGKTVVKPTIAVLFTLLLAVPLSAEQVEGILIDQMCSGPLLKKGYDAAERHTKMCAMMPNSPGFGIVTPDGKYLKFDAEGNKKAATALKASDKKDNLTVSVEGKVDGGNIKVEKLDLT